MLSLGERRRRAGRHPRPDRGRELRRRPGRPVPRPHRAHRVLVFVVDGSLGADPAFEAVETVRGELGAFSAELAAHPGLIAVNRPTCHRRGARRGRRRARAAAGAMGGRGGRRVGEARSGLDDLLRELDRAIERSAARPEAGAEPEPVVPLPREDRLGDYTVRREGHAWRIEGARSSACGQGRARQRGGGALPAGRDGARHVSDAVRRPAEPTATRS